MPSLTITPPLLNSANPWCTTLAQLRELYNSPHTGAVTTRTSLLASFPHDPSIHQFTFYDPNTLSAPPPNAAQVEASASQNQTGSLNTLGYSPLPLSTYLQFVQTISDDATTHSKPFIISVTGPVTDVVECLRLITATQRSVRMRLAMEINLSCPNIPGAPPPAYDADALGVYLGALKHALAESVPETLAHGNIPIGIKTPPYTYQGQYVALLRALEKSLAAEPIGLPCPVDFITATNTLGSALLVSQGDGGYHRTLESAAGTGVGGLAGAPLHPIALGNVFTIRGLLDQHEKLKQIQIIGVGGVEDAEGYRRMRAVGAVAVAVGTALGRKGIRVFGNIGEALRAGGDS